MIDSKLKQFIICNMEYLKEENKNLINLRTSLITIIVVLTGGLAGMIVTRNLDTASLLILFVPGIYFDFVFLGNVLSINKKITKNIEELKNARK